MTARLISDKPDGDVREFNLARPETNIGRSRENDVCLDDASVSRVHASIRVTDGTFVITDKGSLHGTRVNGEKIVSRSLADNDVIEIGGYRLKFVTSDVGSHQQMTAPVVQLDHLHLLLDVTRLMNSSLAVGDVLERVIDAVIQVTAAERGFLMTLTATGELEFRIGRHFDRTALQTQGVTVSGSIVDRVRTSGESVVLSDALDPAAASPYSVIEQGLRSVMCVPLKTQNNFIGLIYVDSHRHSKRFTGKDLELFESLATQAALAIEKSQLYEKLQQHNAMLEEQVRERTVELVQAEKLATVGRLAAGVAHEINSPLGVLASNLDMLGHMVRNPDRPDSKEMVEDIARSSAAATARLSWIVKTFETFAGLDEAEFKSVNINSVIDEVLVFSRSEIPDRIGVERKFEELEPVWCAPGRIRQALMNLVSNAIRSIEGQGSITFETGRQADFAKFTIRDSGRGMSPEQLAKVFDGEFSTKGDRVGLSMGLLVTAQIVRSHRGDLRIDSELGKGTTVTVLLPFK